MAKRKVWFAVGSANGPQSPVYSLFFNTTKADVYVSGRAIAHEVKASLHASGRWRVGFIQDSPHEVTTRDNRSNDRAFVKWERPAPFEPGLTRGFQIVVPPSVVTNCNALLEEPDKVVWVPMPSGGSAVYFDVILSAEGWCGGNVEGVEWPGKHRADSTLLYSHPLCTGETVWVVAYECPFDEEEWIKRYSIEAKPINVRTTNFAIRKNEGCGVYVEMPRVIDKAEAVD